MGIKKHVLFLALTISLIGCKVQSKTNSFAVLTGEFENVEKPIRIERFDMNRVEVSELGRISTDSNGKFTVRLKIKEPTSVFFRLPNSQPVQLFLEPGSKIEMYSKGGKFSFGKKNSYQKTLNNILASYGNFSTKNSISPNDLTLLLDKMLGADLKTFENIRNNLSKKAADYLYFTILGSNFPHRFQYLRSKTEAPEIASRYFKFLSKIDLNNNNAILSKEYSNMITMASPYLFEKAHGFKPPSMIEQYGFLTENIKLTPLQKYTQSVFLLLNYGIFFRDERAEILERYLRQYGENVAEPIKGMVALAPNKAAINFNGVDINKKHVDLKQFKNKLVLIDVWATWCGPCLKEELFLEKLAEEYENELVIFAISFDENKTLWKKYLSQRTIKDKKNVYSFNLPDGIGSEFAKAYFVSGPPRYILINKDNKIIDAFAPYPSSGKLKKLIDDHL